MDLTVISGLLLPAVALVWILVFIPSWFNRAERVQVERRQKQRINTQIAQTTRPAAKPGSVASVAQRVYFLQLLRRVFAFVALAGLVAFGFSFTNFGQLWVVGIAGLAGAAVAAFANRFATVRYQALLAQLSTKRAKVFEGKNQIDLNTLVTDASQANPRAWTPVAVPAPLQKNGTLEQVVLAKVSELPKPAISVEGKDLDLILKRRRNAG